MNRSTPRAGVGDPAARRLPRLRRPRGGFFDRFARGALSATQVGDSLTLPDPTNLETRGLDRFLPQVGDQLILPHAGDDPQVREIPRRA